MCSEPRAVSPISCTPLDPTCADVSAHALEFLAEINQGEESRRRGVAYLKRRPMGRGTGAGGSTTCTAPAWR